MQKVDVVTTNLAFGDLSQRECTDMIVVHHTGNPTDDDLSAVEIHQSHLAKGWSGIGYHFVVRKDGTIEEGRPLWAVGSHAYGENSHTIGIHVCGNFEIGSPTDAQIEKTAMLLANLCWDYNLTIDRKHVVGHRELMATACPGANLFAVLDEIVGKANWYANIEKGNTDNIGDNLRVDGGGNNTSGATVERRVWDFLKGKGLNDYAVAGIMGNLYAESGLKSTNLENYYNQKLAMTDEEYTRAVDEGTYGNFVFDKAGYGLAQWTYYTRKRSLLEYARSLGVSIGNIDMQLNFLWSEFEQYGDMMNTLRNATSVFEASNAVLLDFERPADQGEWVQEKRASFGEEFFEEYHGAEETKEEEREMKRYDSIEELPEWAKPTITKMCDKELLRGDGDTLDLSEDMLRVFVVLDRAGAL